VHVPFCVVNYHNPQEYLDFVASEELGESNSVKIELIVSSDRSTVSGLGRPQERKF
jgi:hypothetical protein